ncbi:MAG: undecaprenyl-diphosphate phosphatase [Lachnospiraceae bacterium]|nr:undecaprenyl-diphosphate phosphatase [Lachnospiraceae bacterium]
MSLLEAIFMGIIQGLTEFLPVSSSGHLAIFKNIFQVNTDTGILFDVLLHIGTLAAVFIVYHRDIGKMIREGFGLLGDAFCNIGIFFKRNAGKQEVPYRRVIRNGYRKFDLLVIVSTIPTAVIGYTARDLVEAASGVLLVPGICLILTSILLFISDRVQDKGKSPKNVTYTNAFGIGICQGIATLPGLSRSGTTITACLISGFDRNFAVKYSFIMSIPAILGAAVLQLKDIGSMEIVPVEVGYYALGTLVAAIVGYVCIKTLLVVVRKKKFTYFAVYCLLIGILSIVGYFVLV